jgi:hypothetical protein
MAVQGRLEPQEQPVQMAGRALRALWVRRAVMVQTGELVQLVPLGRQEPTVEPGQRAQ